MDGFCGVVLPRVLIIGIRASSVLLNGGAMAAMAEWHDGFFVNHHRKFVKGGWLWWHHRPQWHVYMAEF